MAAPRQKAPHVLDPVAAETRVAGGLRTAQSDVTEAHALDGVRLAIELKPVYRAVGRAICTTHGGWRERRKWKHGISDKATPERKLSTAILPVSNDGGPAKKLLGHAQIACLLHGRDPQMAYIICRFTNGGLGMNDVARRTETFALALLTLFR